MNQKLVRSLFLPALVLLFFLFSHGPVKAQNPNSFDCSWNSSFNYCEVNYLDSTTIRCSTCFGCSVDNSRCLGLDQDECSLTAVDNPCDCSGTPDVISIYPEDAGCNDSVTFLAENLDSSSSYEIRLFRNTADGPEEYIIDSFGPGLTNHVSSIVFNITDDLSGTSCANPPPSIPTGSWDVRMYNTTGGVFTTACDFLTLEPPFLPFPTPTDTPIPTDTPVPTPIDDCNTFCQNNFSEWGRCDIINPNLSNCTPWGPCSTFGACYCCSSFLPPPDDCVGVKSGETGFCNFLYCPKGSVFEGSNPPEDICPFLYFCCVSEENLPIEDPPELIDLNCTTDTGGVGIQSAIGCIPVETDLDFIAFIIRFTVGIAGGISFILIIYSGFMITTSSGNAERAQAGKELLTAAVSGLLLIIFSVFLLDVIGVRILALPGF